MRYAPAYGPVLDALEWGQETFCSRVDVQGADSGAPEARIRDHARYMHGRDAHMRQCDMVLAFGALGRISIVILEDSLLVDLKSSRKKSRIH